MQVRERGRAAALVLGLLAVLGALAAFVVGPTAVAGSQARSSATAGSSAGPVRPAAHYPATGEFGGPIGQSHPANSPVPGGGPTRSRIDHPLTASRSLGTAAPTGLRSAHTPAAATVARSLRGHALAATSRAANHLRHTWPGAAALPAALIVAALGLTGLAAASQDRRPNRRTSMGIRGRAPPAPAFA